MPTIGAILAVTLDVAIGFIGLRFLIAPSTAAAGYGVPLPSIRTATPSAPSQELQQQANATSAYLAVKGNRDIAAAIAGLSLLAYVGHEAEAWFMLCLAIEPFMDCWTVLNHGGKKAVAFGVHFATGVVVLLDAALLFWGW